MPWRRRDGRWVAQVRQEGRRIQSIHQTKQEAQDWETDRRREPAENWKTRGGSSLGDLANEYLEYSKIKHSKKTWEEKRDLFKRFFRSNDPNISIIKIKPSDILSYLQAQAGNRSGYSANKDRKNLLAFTSWIGRYKGLVIYAVSQCERFPEIRQGRYIPPEEDFWKVYEVAQGQDKTMLLAYLHLAARRNELFRLTWDDIDFVAGTVRLTTRKRKDGSWAEDWLDMTDDLKAALLAHRDFVGGLYVFPAPGGGPYRYRLHLMGRLCRRAGVRKFGFHAIRHLTATILAEAGVPMIIISQILRHRSIAVTERYPKRRGWLKKSLEVLKKPN